MRTNLRDAELYKSSTTPIRRLPSPPPLPPPRSHAITSLATVLSLCHFSEFYKISAFEKTENFATVEKKKRKKQKTSSPSSLASYQQFKILFMKSDGLKSLRLCVNFSLKLLLQWDPQILRVSIS